jgi:flagellar motor switch protein FliM
MPISKQRIFPFLELMSYKQATKRELCDESIFMAEVAHAKIQPFPFQDCPQYTRFDVECVQKLARLYAFTKDHQDALSIIAEPVRHLLKSEVTFHLSHVEVAEIEDVVAAVADDFLIATFGIDPSFKKAFLIFDPVLARILVTRILTQTKISIKETPELLTKPLTVLEESVVQYVLIDLLEQIKPRLVTQKFNPRFDAVGHQAKDLLKSFKKQERLFLISLRLHWSDQDFYLKLALPLSEALGVGLGVVQPEQKSRRLSDFENFAVDFFLEVGQVTLAPEDVEQLAVGDMVFFDEGVDVMENRGLQGEAQLTCQWDGVKRGYQVDLKTDGGGLQATVRGIL